MSLLLPIDLNEPMDALLAEGRAWAQSLGERLDLLYVDDYPYTIQDPVVQDLLGAEWKRAHELREARLRELSGKLPPAVQGRTTIRIGRAAQEIVEEGKGHRAILMATHGRHGLARVVLGSVAERVVRLSTVPVIVLPRREPEP